METLGGRKEHVERNFGALEFTMERFRRSELPAGVRALFEQNADPDYWVGLGYVDTDNFLPLRAVRRDYPKDVREAHKIVVVRTDGTEQTVDCFFTGLPSLQDLAEYSDALNPDSLARCREKSDLTQFR